MWTNLLDDAIDAIGDESTIGVRTSRERDCVLVVVAHTGPGIPQDARPRVFEPFFTIKDGGRGTGLASTPHGGSSRSATAGPSRSTQAAAARRFPSGCRSTPDRSGAIGAPRGPRSRPAQRLRSRMHGREQP